MTRLDVPKWVVQSHVKFWDESHTLIGSLNDGSLATPDAGDYTVEFPATELFAVHVMSQFQPRVYMTLDSPNGRWYGYLAHFTVRQDDSGDSRLTARFHEYQP